MRQHGPAHGGARGCGGGGGGGGCGGGGRGGGGCGGGGAAEAAAAEAAEAAVAEPFIEHLFRLPPRWGTAKIQRINLVQKPKKTCPGEFWQGS